MNDHSAQPNVQDIRRDFDQDSEGGGNHQLKVGGGANKLSSRSNTTRKSR